MDADIQREIEGEPARRRWLAYGVAVSAVMLVLVARVAFSPGPIERLDLFLFAPALLAAAIPGGAGPVILAALLGLGGAFALTGGRPQMGAQETVNLALYLAASGAVAAAAWRFRRMSVAARTMLEISRRREDHLQSILDTVPEAMIVKETAKIVDLQDPTAKMSKSVPAGCVFLREPLKSIEKKFKSAVTDSETVVVYDPEKKPGVSNLLTILAAFTGKGIPSLVAEYEGKMYGPLKADVADAVIAFAEPFQARVNGLLDDKAELHRLMSQGAERATAVASETVKAVYEKVGLVAR